LTSGRFRRLGEDLVYRGELISVAQATFVDPEGGEFRRDVVHHPGAVSVVPVVDEGTAVLLVRQYRAAIDRELLEIPAGKRDIDGEPVERTARRELEEEVGMRAGRLEQLAEFYNSPGFCDEHSFVFMALDLEACASSAQGVEEQHMTIERVSFDEVPGLIASGGLVDAKSLIGLALARDALGS
jgi:8-oxo-dGTP pyrophosphatase MutT (NUDIX family)